MYAAHGIDGKASKGLHRAVLRVCRAPSRQRLSFKLTTPSLERLAIAIEPGQGLVRRLLEAPFAVAQSTAGLHPHLQERFSMDTGRTCGSRRIAAARNALATRQELHPLRPCAW